MLVTVSLIPPLEPLTDLPADWTDLCARYRQAHAEQQTQAEQVDEILHTLEARTYGRYVGADEAATLQALRDQLESIPQRERAVVEMWKGIAVGMRKDLQNIGRDLDILKGLVGNLNRRLAAVSISNLASLRLTVDERPAWTIVENLECFLHFERLSVEADVALYASGRLSELALEWLSAPELAACTFVQCGDYDPVGLDEYLLVRKAVGDRARLHVPPNLRALLGTYGRAGLVRGSTAVLRRLRASADPDVRATVALLDETGCGLEQEALLLAHPDGR